MTDGGEAPKGAFERIATCEFCCETVETNRGTGAAIISFRGLEYDHEWGVDFERKIRRICKRTNWELMPLRTSDDKLTVVVDFGLEGSRETLASYRKLLQTMKLDLVAAIPIEEFFAPIVGSSDEDDEMEGVE